MTFYRTLLHAATRGETALVKEEMGLLEEPTYDCFSPLEDQCEKYLTTCSVSTKNSYECTTVFKPFEANTFIVTVTEKAMVAFAKDRHFYRQLMTECLLIPRTFGIRDSIVSVREKTSARGVPDQTIPQ